MNIMQAQELFAREIARFPRLGDYNLKFTRSCTVLGVCQPGLRTIKLSKPYLTVGSDEEILDTIRHEIAHALAPLDGHGRLWKLQCLVVGCKPLRCGKSHLGEALMQTIAKFTGTCADCQQPIYYARKPKYMHVTPSVYRHVDCQHKPNRGRIDFGTKVL